MKNLLMVLVLFVFIFSTGTATVAGEEATRGSLVISDLDVSFSGNTFTFDFKFSGLKGRISMTSAEVIIIVKGKENIEGTFSGSSNFQPESSIDVSASGALGGSFKGYDLPTDAQEADFYIRIRGEGGEVSNVLMKAIPIRVEKKGGVAVIS